MGFLQFNVKHVSVILYLAIFRILSWFDQYDFIEFAFIFKNFLTYLFASKYAILSKNKFDCVS